MFVGHYAVSYALKRVDENAPLGQLFVAVQLLDVAWSSLVLLGVEKVKLQPGFLPASPLNLYYMPFTHSMVGALGWAALAALLVLLFSRCAAPARGRTALVMAAAVFSHWLLDVPVHDGDLPLIGNAFKIGFGLWHSQGGTYALEAVLLLGGMALYLKDRPRLRLPVGIFTAALLLINAANIFAPQIYMPEQLYAVGALISYGLFAVIAGWADRRAARTNRAAAALAD
jgi:hypothetical protein